MNNSFPYLNCHDWGVYPSHNPTFFQPNTLWWFQLSFIFSTIEMISLLYIYIWYIYIYTLHTRHMSHVFFLNQTSWGCWVSWVGVCGSWAWAYQPWAGPSASLRSHLAGRMHSMTWCIWATSRRQKADAMPMVCDYSNAPKIEKLFVTTLDSESSDFFLGVTIHL
jgi:hypothetical protein